MRPNLSQSPLLGIGKKGLDVSKLFKTSLWTGNGTTQTITGVGFQPDFLWVKCRNSASYIHSMVDSLRGGRYQLNSSGENAENVWDDPLHTFGADGFTLGSNGAVNADADNFVGWSFKRAERFFDIVTWTGNGVDGRDIAHALGVRPALVIVKCRSNAQRWKVGTLVGGYSLILNTEAGIGDGSPPPYENGYVDMAASNAATFRLKLYGTIDDLNKTGYTYVAYLFAEDTAADACVKVGTYTGNGSDPGPTVNLGWQPQFVMLKRVNSPGPWAIVDAARGMPSGYGDPTLRANLTNSESLQNLIDVTPTGFTIGWANSWSNMSGEPFLYLAIRAPGA